MRKLCIAPMMDCTDRHYRYFVRFLTKRTLLYTEMLTAAALIHGDRDKLLGHDAAEYPLALQLGGSDPRELALAAKMAEDYGHCEVNLNVGCPSDRVQAGQFGACLMKQPKLVAECVAAMLTSVSIPVTVKMRIGVDDCDSYAQLAHFTEQLAQAGCKVFIVHARKAWLQGLSPRQNREIPPLRYDVVYRLKNDFPDLQVVINGGVKTLVDAQQHLRQVDGVMIGREAYANPALLRDVDQEIFGDPMQAFETRKAVEAYLPYVDSQLAKGVRLRSLIRHLSGLFRGQSGARAWRRYLSEHGHQDLRGVAVIEDALTFV